MIALIRGTLRSCEEGQLLLDVAGIGYEVTVPAGLTHSLPRLGQEVEIYTHLYVREDNMQLFGFRSLQERALFRLLLRAPGIGPKVALAILDTFKGDELFSIVTKGDAHGLQRVPGVGAKSAQRLILELAGKLDGMFEASSADQDVSASLATDEASQALSSLGYSRQEVETVMKQLTKGKSAAVAVSELVRKALKELSKGREG